MLNLCNTLLKWKRRRVWNSPELFQSIPMDMCYYVPSRPKNPAAQNCRHRWQHCGNLQSWLSAGHDQCPWTDYRGHHWTSWLSSEQALGQAQWAITIQLSMNLKLFLCKGSYKTFCRRKVTYKLAFFICKKVKVVIELNKVSSFVDSSAFYSYNMSFSAWSFLLL